MEKIYSVFLSDGDRVNGCDLTKDEALLLSKNLEKDGYSVNIAKRVGAGEDDWKNI